VEIGDALETPAAGRQPGKMGLEVLRRAVVERERIDREPYGLALLEQPFGCLGAETGEVENAVGILAGELGGIADMLRPARMHGDAAVHWQPSVAALPGGEILA